MFYSKFKSCNCDFSKFWCGLGEEFLTLSKHAFAVTASFPRGMTSLRFSKWLFVLKSSNQGWETYLPSQVAWIVHYRWRAEKYIRFILKLCPYLTMRKSDFTWFTIYSEYMLFMELRFDAMLYFNLGNENSDAGHIKWSRGPHLPREPQVPNPWLECLWTSLIFVLSGCMCPFYCVH